MRLGLFLALALVVAGCGSDNGAGGNDLAMSVGDDLSMGGAGGGGGGGAGGGGGGNTDGFVITDGGAVGTQCTTACDCMPGLACVQGKCNMTNTPVYCCGSTSCPNGAICERMQGGFGRCGVGAPDLAGFDPCSLITCNGAQGKQRCTNAGCTMCVANGNGGMSCAK